MNEARSGYSIVAPNPTRSRGPHRIWAIVLTLVAMLFPLGRDAEAQSDGSPRWAGPFTTGGYIVSSPAIGADGTVYFGSQDKHLYAVGADGSLKWRFQTGDWVDASPAIGEDGTIYFGSWDGKIYALTPNGAKKWEFSAGTGNYIYSSPALAMDGTIYFGAGDANFYALRPDGTLKWTFPTGDWIDSSPAIGANNVIYFGSWDGNIYAIRDEGDAASEVWRFATNAPVLTSPALGRDGTVYIGSNDGVLYAIEGATGVKRWDFATNGTLESSPAVGPDGIVYVGGGAPYLHALNPNGTLKWKTFLVDPIVGTPAVRGDGTIIFGTTSSAIYGFHPTGITKWKVTTGDWVDSSPVIAADGTIFVGSYDKKLYALNGSGSPASSFSEWPMFRRSATHVARVTAIPPGGFLVNLSTRAQAGPQLNLIPGFVVAGTAAKSFLVRAVGPTLAPHGVPNPLADPALEFQTTIGGVGIVIARNDNWSSAPNAPDIMQAATKTGAFPLPSPSLDAALLLNVPPGLTHTALATSTTGTAGITLVEVYDAATENADARLVNLSTRAMAGTGAEALTPGLVIGGVAPVRLLVRAVGPTLTDYGVPNVLTRPSLTLFSGQTAIASNTGWTTNGHAADLSAAFQAAGAFSLGANSADSAMIVTLNPGAYTMRVSGVDETTGEALVEVYVLQ